MSRALFDDIARYYDATRTLDPAAAARALGTFSRRFPPEKHPRVLELGVGTGRFALEMARQGFHVTGIDLSSKMLEQFRRRRWPASRGSARAVRANATSLPFRDGAFDGAYWVHVLHLIPDWRAALDELTRVVRPGGFLMMGRTEGGPDLDVLHTQYHRRLGRRGFPHRTIGVRRRDAVLRALRRRGAKVVLRSRAWTWREVVSVGEALRYLGLRGYSRTRTAPLNVHRAVMREVRAWAVKRFGGLSHTERVTGSIRFVVAVRGGVPIERAPQTRARRSHGRPRDRPHSRPAGRPAHEARD
ncbi:MAG TPA: class I SAM-dependent methyltransferase [Thermoplasmata archaeon]|nr:class I SAM-dependent methyltransferase [Thermoplasmata archaeon]